MMTTKRNGRTLEYTAAQAAAAREWLTDCWGTLDPESEDDIADLSDEQCVKATDRDFGGGWDCFDKS